MTSLNINKPIVQFKNAQCCPLTPNLEEIKQKRIKEKQKHKNMLSPTCPPTNHPLINPPTPKIPKCKQGVLKRSSHKSREFRQFSHAHNLSNWNQYQNKQNISQNDRDNDYYYQSLKTQSVNSNQKSHKNKHHNQSKTLNDCLQSGLSERYRKEDNLKQFLNRVQRFQCSLENTSAFLAQKLQEQEQNFHQNAKYINQCFTNLIQEVKEKQHQMTNNIFLAQQSLKKTYKFNIQQVQKIKCSLNRYVNDINLHYQQIIEEVQFQKFVDIIYQYQSKVDFFQQRSQKMKSFQKINVYIPCRQLGKVLNKSNVEYYQPQMVLYCVQNGTSHRHKRNNSIKQNEANIRNHSNQYQKDYNKRSCTNLLAL